MDGQDYLNQISASNRPAKSSKIGNFLSSKIALFGLIAIVALIIIIIIGAVLSGNKTDTKTLSYRLKLHLDNTTEVIKTYQDDVKSSNLRSLSASLYGILSDTNNKLTKYLTEKYNFKPKEVSEKLIAEYALSKDALSNELFEAKINGILDRVYAHKMAYEISIINTEESRISNSAKDEELIEFLNTSYDSLSNLFDSFNNFSETK